MFDYYSLVSNQDIMFGSYFWKTCGKAFGTPYVFICFPPSSESSIVVIKYSLGTFLGVVGDMSWNYDLLLLVVEFNSINFINMYNDECLFDIISSSSPCQSIDLVFLPISSRLFEL